MKLADLFEDVSAAQFSEIKNLANKLWSKLGIEVAFTTHFLERTNDERNKNKITAAELVRLFKIAYAEHRKEVVDFDVDTEAVFLDLLTTVYLPFVIHDTTAGKKKIFIYSAMRRAPPNVANKKIFKIK